MRRTLFVFLMVVCLAATAAAEDRGKREKRDTSVEPTSRGRVIGQVYDARTGAPVEGATVRVRQDGAFAEKGPTVDETDAEGRYQCRAVIGRLSSNFDIGRALSSGLAGILIGGANNETKRVDITRLSLRVEREGYRPFEGVVLCRSVDPSRFTVAMQPILLADASGAEVSTSAEGWGVARVADVTVEPAVLRPNTQATVTVRVQSPPVVKLHDVKAACLYRLGDRWYKKDLKPVENAAGGALAFTGTFGIPKSAKGQAEELFGVLTRCPYDIAAGGDRRGALLQVATDDAEEQSAAKRAEAYRLLQAGENVEAAARLKEIMSQPGATAWDVKTLAEVSRTLHDSATAVTALKRLVEMTPPRPENRRMEVNGAYAAALVANGEGERALSECEPLVDSIKEKDRPGRIPVPLMVALGNAYLQEGKLAEAESISRQLLQWDDAGLYPDTGEFRNALRLKEAEAKLKAEPASGRARAEYGRVLMDQGRWEEAVGELRASLQADPDLPAVQRDLSYALLHVRGGETAAGPDLDQALASAESQVRIADDKGRMGKSKDFFSWHALGMLLYSKARRQQDAHEPAAAETFARCREVLREALRCGRSGAAASDGLYLPYLGYASPSVVAISGFAYPEANDDFVILESLETLEKAPDDYLAQLNLGTALIDLGQPALAREPVRRAREAKPDCVEAQYADALIALQTGDREGALALLRAVLKANPRHPYANLKLARLYTEDGDTAAAAACLAAHAQVYGPPK